MSSVVLYLYDISQGMARALSPSLLGKQLDGIWHTGIVVYGHEYYYGGGIQWAMPGQTLAGRPAQKIDLGRTDVPMEEFHAFLQELSPRFTPETYSLLRHNCNNFTSECAKRLTGRDIPEFIIGLPEEVRSTPMGAMFLPMIESMEMQMRQGMAAQGGGGFGMVPWQEQGGAGGRLSLPRQVHPMPVHNDLIPHPGFRNQPAAAAPAPAIKPSAEAKPAPFVTEEKTPLARTFDPGHPHAVLELKLVSKISKPMLSVDDKHSSFVMLVKTTASKIMNPELQLTAADKATLQALSDALSNKDAPVPPAAIALLDGKLLKWPNQQLFAVLALARLVVVRADAAGHYEKQYQAKQAGSLVEVSLGLQPGISDGKAVDNGVVPQSARLMALCTLSNLFKSFSFGRLLSADDRVSQVAMAAVQHSDVAVRLVGAALLYNISLYIDHENIDAIATLVSFLTDSIPQQADAETTVRLLMSLGHLCYHDSQATGIVQALELDLDPVVAKFTPDHVKIDTKILTRLTHVVFDMKHMLSVVQAEATE